MTVQCNSYNAWKHWAVFLWAYFDGYGTFVLFYS